MSGDHGLADDAWAAIDRIPGWLTRDQAEVLAGAARALRPGCTVVEIGSHHGRSAAVLAGALPEGGRLVAVDPFPEDWRYGGRDTQQRLVDNLVALGVAQRVDVRAATSAEALATWEDRVDLVYVDGKHDVASAAGDLGWGRFVPPGGTVLLHDAFSSLGVTLAVLVRVLPSRDLRYVSRTGSLAVLQRGRPSLRDRARVLAELPWFVRNLVVKVLLRLRLRGPARLLGHHDVADPY
ncbi:MAG: hypothetical protein JWO46_2463 [Nocardioidaceae bacterium]|nr:hypothetical protein [Nocardioidaceae bacterium]